MCDIAWRIGVDGRLYCATCGRRVCAECLQPLPRHKEHWHGSPPKHARCVAELAADAAIGGAR